MWIIRSCTATTSTCPHREQLKPDCQTDELHRTMLLLSNLRMQEKKRLCHIVTKVYLLRWRIEEYFRFKKQQFELEDLRVMSLQSIRNLFDHFKIADAEAFFL